MVPLNKPAYYVCLQDSRFYFWQILAKVSQLVESHFQFHLTFDVICFQTIGLTVKTFQIFEEIWDHFVVNKKFGLCSLKSFILYL